MAEGETTHVIYRGDVVVVTGHSNALNRAGLPTRAGWAAAFGLAAARFFRWE